MSKVKLLLDVVQDVENLASSLHVLANSIMANDDTEVNPINEVAEKPTNSQPKLPTLEEVRAVLVKKETSKVKALITESGYTKLSDIDSSLYPELLEKAEGLPDVK